LSPRSYHVDIPCTTLTHAATHDAPQVSRTAADPSSSAHCEEQIVVPNTGILYCSEKCRRRDQAKPPPIPIKGVTIPFYNSYGLTPPRTPPDGPPPTFIEPLCPTPPRYYSSGFEEFGITKSVSTVSLTSSCTPERRTSPVDLQHGSPPSTSNIYHPPRRPNHIRSMTAGSVSTLSALSAAPTHIPHTVPAYSSYQYGEHRPLPPLHRPSDFSSSPRSLDLVTPVMSMPTPPRTDSAPLYSRSHSTTSSTLHYEKKKSITSASEGSLKTLFNFDAIRSEPEELASSSPGGYHHGSPMLRMSPTGLYMKN